MPENRDEKLVTLFNSSAVCQYWWSPADVVSCRGHQVKVNKSELSLAKPDVSQRELKDFLKFISLFMGVRRARHLIKKSC